MKKLSIYIFFLFVCFQAGATAQMADVLICGKDTFMLFSNPLEYHPQYEKITKQIFNKRPSSFITSCWRGYVAEWRLEKGKLYLSGIKAFFDYEHSDPKALAEIISNSRVQGKKMKVFSNGGASFSGGTVTGNMDMESLFPGKVTKNGVFASWVNQTLIVPKGECVYYIHDGYESIYEREEELYIMKGILIRKREFDNSRCRKGNLEEEVWMKHLAQTICWYKIPRLDHPMRVSISCTMGGKSGRFEDIRIVRSSGNGMLDKEAVRVVSLYPNCDIIYRKGKYKKITMSFPIIFTEKLREQCYSLKGIKSK